MAFFTSTRNSILPCVFLGMLVYRFLYSAYRLSGIAWAPDSAASHVFPNGCANLISLKTPGSSCCSRILPALGSGVRQKLGMLLEWLHHRGDQRAHPSLLKIMRTVCAVPAEAREGVGSPGARVTDDCGCSKCW